MTDQCQSRIHCQRGLPPVYACQSKPRIVTRAHVAWREARNHALPFFAVVTISRSPRVLVAPADTTTWTILRQMSISSLYGSRCVLVLSSKERGSAVTSASQCTLVHYKASTSSLKFRVRTFTFISWLDFYRAWGLWSYITGSNSEL